MKNLLLSAWALVKENRRAYLAINVIYYGLVAVFMIYVAFNPALQRSLLDQIGSAFMTGPLSFVGTAYSNVLGSPCHRRHVLRQSAAWFFRRDHPPLADLPF